MKRRRFSFFLLMLCSVTFCYGGSKSLREGDYLFKRGDYADALKTYLSLLAKDENDPNVLWRVGATINRIALNIEGKPQIDTLRKANEYLTRAIHIRTDIPEPHIELAWNLTYLGLLNPEWSDLRLAGRIREEILYALSLQPQSAVGYFLYGLWNRRVSKIPLLKRMPEKLNGASRDSCIVYLKKAFELQPDNALFGLELAYEQLDQGDTISSVRTLEMVSKCSDIPANILFKTKASEMLNKIGR